MAISDDEIVQKMFDIRSFILKIVNNDDFNKADITDEQALAYCDEIIDELEE